MAGTDRSKAPGPADAASLADAAAPSAPCIVLIEPQLAENIGTTARAMLNCGLEDLRLVRPREAWPNRKARAAASGADAVLDAARLFETTEAAIGDLARVYASTARPREMIKPVVTPRQAALEMRAHIARGERVGVLLGPERTGLVNDDMALADTILCVPLNPGFSSLNLAQAALIVAYEWRQAGDATPPRRLVTNATRPAAKALLLEFFAHLERELDSCGFLRNLEKRPSMVRNIRNLFQRAELTEQEIRTLHGIVKELSTERARRRRRGAPAQPEV